MTIRRAETFADLLRRYRRAAGLTQEELAERAGLSVKGVGDLERGAKLRPRRDTIRLLAIALNLSEAQLAELSSAIRNANVAAPPDNNAVATSATPAAAQPALQTPHNLPAQITSFIGRQVELEQIRGLLTRRGRRLVTMTGPGGTGKTRLALEAAATLLADFRDGVFLVGLAALADPALVAAEIARTLALTELTGQALTESLKSHLREKQLLLLLDNFEHLLPAAPLVGDLLAAAPRLQVLVTSRALLHLRGEQDYPVPPLALPDVAHLNWRENEAVRLFEDRACEARPDFVLTEETGPVVAAIVRRLDGLPLAIELAAARVKLLSPQALLARLENRLQLLTGGAIDLPPRQQTIRRTIEWSHSLLGAGEQRLFARLAVFAAGCTLEAVEDICTADDEPAVDILEGLGSLADKSLLYKRHSADGAARFLMLETIHEYAWEQLRQGGTAEVLRRRHALYFMKLAQTARDHLTAETQAEWLSRLDEEHDNLRAALQWINEHAKAESESSADDVPAITLGLQAADALWRFWYIRGYISEGRRQVEAILAPAAARARDLPALHSLLAAALNAAGDMALAQADNNTARTYFEEGLRLSRAIGDKRSMALSTHDLGFALRELGELAASEQSYRESLALGRELEEKWMIANCLDSLAILADMQGDYGAGQPLRQESLMIRRELGDIHGESTALINTANAAYLQGQYETACSFYRQSLTIRHRLRDALGQAVCLSGLGAALVGLSTGGGADISGLKEGVRLLGAATALLESAGAAFDSTDRAAYEHGIAVAHAVLGEQAFDRLLAEGKAMSSEQAIASALQTTYDA